MNNTEKAYSSLIVSVILNSTALILLKAVAGILNFSNYADFFQTIPILLKNWMLWCGGISFAAGLFFWTLSLKSIPLSIAYPISSISYIFIALISWRLFEEELSGKRILGMIIIMLGVLILYRNKRETRK